jgi:hypothetical protein
MNWNDPLVIIFGATALALVAIFALAVLPSTPAFRQILVGVAADPQLVGIMRALVAYIVPIGIGGAVAYVQGWTDPRLLPLVPLLIGAIRVIEGRLDGIAKPEQNAVNPPPVAGSGGGNPAA